MNEQIKVEINKSIEDNKVKTKDMEREIKKLNNSLNKLRLAKRNLIKAFDLIEGKKKIIKPKEVKKEAAPPDQ